METNILKTIKKMLGIAYDDTHFDLDLMIHINSAFSVLTQLGVGPDTGFSMRTGDETWSDFLGTATLLDMVISYTFLRVRALFDPPSNASLLEAFEKMIKEYEWRIEVAVTESGVNSNGS